MHSHAQHCAARARVAPAPQQPRRAIALGTPAPSNFAGRARTRRANPAAVRRRSIYRATHRALPARLPPYADYILRLQDTEPESFEIDAAPSSRRITTRRRLAGGVRRTGGQHPSVRGAISAPVRGTISARVPPSTPSRHARSTRQPIHTQHTPLRTHTTRQAHTSSWTRRGTLERGQDDPPHDLRRHQPLQSPGIQAHHPQVCPPARPAISHA